MRRSPGRGGSGWRRLRPRRRRGFVWVAFTLGIAVNGLRLRRRLSGIGWIDTEPRPVTGGPEDGFVVVTLPGVDVDDATRREAIAYAVSEGLDVVDLVPGDLPVDELLALARGLDATTYRSDPFATGRSAGHAVVVRRDVWERATPGDAVPPRDRADLAGLTARLKQYAARSTDAVVAPRLHAVAASPAQRLRELKVVYTGLTPLAIAIPAARSSLLLAGMMFSPGWGAAAVVGFVLQPSLVTGGRRVPTSGGRVAGLAGAAGRSFVEPFLLVRTALAGGAADDGEPDPIESRRPEYAELLSQGLERFFEPRSTTCPACGGAELEERLRMPDWVQFKPGEFVLDRCEGCGHIFQNPRLSLEGLDFYYRDMYDGLGAHSVQFLFSQAGESYRGRVDMVRRHVSPRRWLDVGSGYGHFCMTAKGSLPDTRFDGLDMSESIEEAGRRRWVDTAYRGLFPDLAPELAGNYDVVSMHHYLEHTLDPWAELDAAASVLEPGGHLLIEVPDPECRFSQLLGRAWVPWIQPQHLHFLSVANLRGALTARGFSVVEVERGSARQPIDLSAGLLMRANALAPPPAPWREPQTAVERVRRTAVMTAATPLAALAIVADQAVLQPLIRTRAQGWSNCYRLLARRN